jgi:hypothetical protein
LTDARPAVVANEGAAVMLNVSECKVNAARVVRDYADWARLLTCHLR